MGSSLKCTVLLLCKIKAQKQNIVNVKAVISIFLTIGGVLITAVKDDMYAVISIVYVQ
jgi:hypothetical protein